MSVPAIIVIVWLLLSLLIGASEDGETKVVKSKFAFTLLRVGLLAFLLYCGGFFQCV